MPGTIMTHHPISAAIIAEHRRHPDRDLPAAPEDIAGTAPQLTSWVAACMRFGDDLTLVTADPARLLDWDSMIVSDHFDPPTELSGLQAGLFAAHHEHQFVTSAALPVVSPALMDLLIGTLEPRFDAVVLEAAGRAQLLPAIYSKRCLKSLGRQLADGDNDIRRFLRQLRIHAIEEKTWRACDLTWQPIFQE